MSIPGELHLAYRIIIDPLESFRQLKTRSFMDSLTHILEFGWVTAILSGVLRLYGVDYGNPSNAGGSAQIFAAWVFGNVDFGVAPLFQAVIFAVLVMIGYLVLALISTPILAAASWVLMGRPSFDELPRLSIVAVSYGMTPGFLFGWMPNPFYFVGLWATLWQALAVKEVFGFSWVRSLLVVFSWVLGVAILHDLAGFILRVIVG